MGGWLVERERQRLDGTVIVVQATVGCWGRLVSGKINCLPPLLRKKCDTHNMDDRSDILFMIY